MLRMKDGTVRNMPLIQLDEDATVSWERLPDPEPKWRLGHVVQDADGFKWVFVDPESRWSWFRPGSPRDSWGAWRSTDAMSRPLIILAEPREPVIDAEVIGLDGNPE
jgi:hypothetical protein